MQFILSSYVSYLNFINFQQKSFTLEVFMRMIAWFWPRTTDRSPVTWLVNLTISFCIVSNYVVKVFVKLLNCSVNLTSKTLCEHALDDDDNEDEYFYFQSELLVGLFHSSAWCVVEVMFVWSSMFFFYFLTSVNKIIIIPSPKKKENKNKTH